MPLRPRSIPTEKQIFKIEKAHDWYRASGDCKCNCGKLYYDHPYFAEPYEWINVLCNGDLVKL